MMHWVSRQLPENEEIRALARALSTRQPFPMPIANILVQRGIKTYEQARYFFAPDKADLHDPFLMKDMQQAVDRLLKAYQQQEKVLLYGDYDVDGTSAVSLLSLFMEAWGMRFDTYLPDRYREGYGVSYQGVDYAQKVGAGLIISLDCGIKAVDKVKYAALKGIDFIVCDHHRPGSELPEAVAVLDPKRPDCPYPFKELTGCGVGYKLAEALHQRLRALGHTPPAGDFDPFDTYCDLLTLSIACDIVPMLGENRLMAYFGLQKLRANPLPGLQAIMNQAEEQREWDISDLVFFVGPRVNSAGRLGHARDAVEVLTGKSNRLHLLADDLQSSNDTRKHIDREITQEALSMIASDRDFERKSTTVLYNPSWHKGVIGIVASRLIERHYRPTILLTQSEGKLVGSARSVAGFDLYEALSACSDYLLQFGGHKYAAGLSLKAETLQPFQAQFEQVVARNIRPEQKVPVLYIDHQLDFQHIDARFVRLLNRLEPFGPENRKPVFMASGVSVLHARVLKEAHIKFVLQQQGGQMLEAIGFNMAEKWEQIKEGPIDIAYQPIFNTWNQQTKINLRLKDFRTSNEK
ncbi:MAG: single-stranded-DNA-specific exonuclease RecJ [Bacteroidetes bacterium]|nr:MAG: single-stranded-DNA-specific exonuclease RecJ [Bacteroidota bacterium]